MVSAFFGFPYLTLNPVNIEMNRPSLCVTSYQSLLDPQRHGIIPVVATVMTSAGE